MAFWDNLVSDLNNLKLKPKRCKLKCGASYEESNYVFTTSTGSLIDVPNLSHAWEHILKKANLPHKKFHSLRHTFATILFENEVLLKTVSKILGHRALKYKKDYERIYINEWFK